MNQGRKWNPSSSQAGRIPCSELCPEATLPELGWVTLLLLLPDGNVELLQLKSRNMVQVFSCDTAENTEFPARMYRGGLQSCAGGGGQPGNVLRAVRSCSPSPLPVTVPCTCSPPEHCHKSRAKPKNGQDKETPETPLKGTWHLQPFIVLTDEFWINTHYSCTERSLGVWGASTALTVTPELQSQEIWGSTEYVIKWYFKS